MSELYSRVTEEARNQYTLAYAPSGTDRRTDHHSIEVRVRREGLTILARKGYYEGAMAPGPVACTTASIRSSRWRRNGSAELTHTSQESMIVTNRNLTC